MMVAAPVLGSLVGCVAPSSPALPTLGPTDTGTWADTAHTAAPCDTAEIVGDGIDENCNGWADELGFGVSAQGEADLVIVGEAGDRIGSSIAAGVDADGVAWVALGGREGFGVDRLPMDGVVDAWITDQADYYVSWEVAVTDWAGPLVAVDPDGLGTYALTAAGPEDALATLPVGGSFAVGDLDGDGTDDLATVGGGVFVYGPPDTWPEPRWRVSGYAFGRTYLTEVTIADLTGDGRPEVLAPEDDAQELWIFPGDATGEHVAADLGWAVRDGVDAFPLQQTVAVGDLTGDGWPDLACGGAQGAGTGRLWVIPGPILADTDPSAAQATVLSGDDGLIPNVAAVLPDQDGDGADELVVTYGAWIAIHRGGGAGTLLATDAARVLVSEQRDAFGRPLVPVDADLDGTSDLVVGAPFSTLGGRTPVNEDTPEIWSGIESGAVYLFRGPLVP